MRPPVAIDLDSFGTIRIESTSGAASIESSIPRDPDEPEYNAAIDGVEALLLSLYSQGIPLGGKAVRDAIFGALEAIDNNLG